MPIKIKDSATLAKKFVRNASQAVGDYKDNVATAGQDWETGAIAGEGSFEQGVQAAIGRKAFGKGIRKAGGAKFAQNASTKGAARFVGGIQAAENDWATGFAPVATLLQGLNLPPKGPKRSPQNQARANAVSTALGNWKEGR